MGALRILTGILAPTRTPGTATIQFNPHVVTGDAQGAELSVSGAIGDFETPPGKVVSLRQFKIADRDAWMHNRHDIDMFTIDDGDPTNDHMVVSWSTDTGGRIEEISYLVAGEA